MKQIDEKSLKELNSFLTTRKGLEICNVNLADIISNYTELLAAARTGISDVKELVKKSVTVPEAVAVKAPPVTIPTPVSTVVNAGVINKVVPNAEKVPVQQEAITSNAVPTAPLTVTSNVSNIVKENIPTPVTNDSEKAEDKADTFTHVTMFEGSVEPHLPKKNDLWQKTSLGKVEILKFDGEKWNPIK